MLHLSLFLGAHAELGIENSVDEPVDRVETQVVELLLVQYVHQVLEHSLVGVNYLVFQLLVQRENPGGDAHEAFFFALVFEQDQVAGRMHPEVQG